MQNYEEQIKTWGKNKIKAASQLKFLNKTITVVEKDGKLKVAVEYGGKQNEAIDLGEHMTLDLHYHISTQMKKEIVDDLGTPIEQAPLRIKETLAKHFEKVLGDFKTWLASNAESSILQYMGMAKENGMEVDVS